MASNSQPWQNRQSIIACWEHVVSAEDLSGALILSLSSVMHGQSTPNVPVCVPRACRLTRICFVWFFDTSDPGNIVYNFQRSPDCGVSFPTTQVSFPVGIGGFAENCLCTNLNVVFDHCDQWKSFFDFSGFGGMSFPIFRVNHHFELR